MTREETKGYRKLAARVIALAVQDFRAPVPCLPIPWTPRTRTEAMQRKLYEAWRDNRRDAYTFFTDPESSFHLWAAWLGLDTERVRKVVLGNTP